MSAYYYLVPTTQTTMPDGNTVTTPEYFSTDLKGLTFTCLPFGVEGIVILALASLNTALAAEADVFAFPSNLAAVLTDTDVTSLTNYAAAYNIPTSQLAAGQMWATVLRTLACVFLAAQYASGLNGGQSLFTVNTTGKLSLGQVSQPSAALNSLTPATFNFTNADPTTSVADALLAASAQFTGPIHTLNGDTL